MRIVHITRSLAIMVYSVLIFIRTGWTTSLIPGISFAGRQSSFSELGRPQVHHIPHTEDSLRLDGVLDESFWAYALIVDLPYEIDPGENIPARVKTICYLITGLHHIYVGFRAFDPDPKRIRAHYMDRDTAWEDDWILLELDPVSDQRRGFEFMANPLGVQMDCLLNEVGSAENELDRSWDAVWDSSGRITSEGYVVEMAIPFMTLRFPAAQGVQSWGFQVMRHYPREFSYFFRHTSWNRNRNCVLCENSTLVGFENASPGRNIEINPAVVVHRKDDHEAFPEGQMVRGQARPEVGISSSWGIIPSVIANMAINPDFSQVEADTPQLEVNTRFSLFYPEKRPFFMEGVDLFGTPLPVVYTRMVYDPAWGIKLTGKAGANAFGILFSEDASTSLLIPANQGSRLEFLEQQSFCSVLRYRRDFGGQSTVGILVTDRRGKGYFNSLLGADGHIQLGLAGKLRLQILYSRTSFPEVCAEAQGQPNGTFSSRALSLAYLHEARNWNWWAKYEDIGRDFRADLGFIPRVDLRLKEAGVQRVLWSDSTGWFRKWIFAIKGSFTHNQGNDLTDRILEASVEYNGPLQSSFRLGLASVKEIWGTTPFEQKFVRIESSIRSTGSLLLSLTAKIGDAVDYVGSRPANILRIQPGLSWFMGRHLQLGIDHVLEILSVSGGRLYRAGLSQVRIVYQFNVRTFFRAIVQYLDLNRNPDLYVEEPDPINHHLFVQLLFSYKVSPRTLFFLGYSDNHFGWPGQSLKRKDRTLFLKVSYAWNY